ncbi:AraC family transcriptional regulator [Isoalcanivorax beigongshangi]|uniref:Helix-turn-helix transcriptional regulator n=1 Tax=Isoalcanivorax beigongshangi TaxID=3238810 RepID=A0ABV4AEL7_9GAMM
MWLAADAVFDPDQVAAPVVGIASTLREHDSGLHCHRRGQVLFARHGCIRLTLADQRGVLPPQRAAWIPPQVVHRVQLHAVVGYRSVYVDVARCPGWPAQPKLLDVPPLLREVLEQMALAAADTDWQQHEAAAWLTLCRLGVLRGAEVPTWLPLPRDRRLAVLHQDQLPPPLHQLAATAGASARTLTRLMRAETGLGYQQWRQQWRLLKGIEILAGGARLADAAAELGFDSDTALVAFFRTMTGTTPRRYLAVAETSAVEG